VSIPKGTRLGAYEIGALIGAGGMGEVYRAHDTKLERDVAIKVLPEAFARDPERVARFKREAKLLASLNHPNIAAIYDLEEDKGRHFLVMELVEGETLADHVRRGPVEMADALRIASQIAEALEHAHEKTVIHRDLKPANVKVTPEGKVKVLDFGLAKAFAAAPEIGGDPGNSPTLSAMPTLPGVILGTAAYMSPEQARGKIVDKRTDIWALGCVLFELLTGKQTFRGEDVTEILASVVKSEPDWAALPVNMPHGIRVLLRRCLEKDRTRRFHAAADVLLYIEETLATPAPASTAPARRSWKAALAWGLGSLALAALTGIAVWQLRPEPTPQLVSRTIILLPPDRLLGGTADPMLALSPDGTQLAYTASGGAARQIYLRAMDSQQARPIAGTEGAIHPFFSPDGQWIGFFAGGKLKKISVTGGASLTLSDSPTERGASWGMDGTIVFAPRNTSPLFKVSAAGGTPQELTQLKQGESSHRWPQFLPDGRALLFAIQYGATAAETSSDIASIRLDTGEQKVLIRGGTSPKYVPTGHLVYYRAGTIMAVAFDLERLEVQGTPSPVVENVMATTNTTDGAQFSFSNAGTIVYVEGAGQAGALLSLVWVDRNGKEVPLTTPPKSYIRPRFSPDGRQLAFEIAGAKTDIWIFDLVRETLTPLTFTGDRQQVGWTADGTRVVFESLPQGGKFNLYWRPSDGSSPEEILATNEYGFSAPSVSPDGKWLAYHEVNPKTNRNILVLPLDGERKPKPLLHEPYGESAPAFSPDGRWLAYVSDESGQIEVYVRPFPSLDGKWRISMEGGTAPRWNPNGRELFYRIGNKMMAVEVTTQPSFTPAKPKVVFEGTYEPDPGGGRPNYDVSPDGQRFLMMKPAEQQAVALTQINVVLNWFAELKRRVPVTSDK